MDIDKMTPRRPYLVRAFYDWIVDNDLTPHLVADATLPGVQVPMEFVSDGQIVLNIAPRAVGNLLISDDAVQFNARFSGRPQNVMVPMYAVMALYARENGAGTMFEPEPGYEEIDVNYEEPQSEAPVSSVHVVEATELDDSDEDGDDTPPPPPSPPKGRPSLRVVK
ncbi:ClpXP protease specificity-enhancing factor [Vibrio sp. SS-MA-C1-2]|uniref:ClpXP protease specificity-enhancing factor n=1 Tax=Vibrio sp. SS-MA-C1-2 TaxID=2908646 RepID=UPI001F44CBC0|nr:ClpXP protease specificity-enhancing factor [Vibrio sp. SS-MA-C1-2]UJF19084.1 ClpXP protease specificity-enhancing factor [Vibrio sp. SS-MA-C1-2]